VVCERSVVGQWVFTLNEIFLDCACNLFCFQLNSVQEVLHHIGDSFMLFCIQMLEIKLNKIILSSDGHKKTGK
jgi:hypothetical protein